MLKGNGGCVDSHVVQVSQSQGRSEVTRDSAQGEETRKVVSQETRGTSTAHRWCH